MEKRFCYYIPVNGNKDGLGFIPSVVYEGEAGHFPLIGDGSGASPWRWGNTLSEAESICKTRNHEKLGLSDEEINEIIISSMFHK